MNQMPIEAALSHARGASQFSGDGAVMHRLADEVETLRLQLKQERALAASRLASAGIAYVPAGDDGLYQ